MLYPDSFVADESESETGVEVKHEDGDEYEDEVDQFHFFDEDGDEDEDEHEDEHEDEDEKLLQRVRRPKPPLRMLLPKPPSEAPGPPLFG